MRNYFSFASAVGLLAGLMASAWCQSELVLNA